MNAAVALSEASIGYARKSLFKDLSLTIDRGQWVSILGPNGCGKTTLLKVLLGALEPLSGHRKLGCKKLGYVPQKFSLPQDNPLTVLEFFQLRPQGPMTLSPRQRELLETFSLDKSLNEPLSILSRGELQRAVLAFSLLHEPDLVFLDEYLEGLDPEGQSMITGYLETLHASRGLTVIEVSHDISAVVHVANRVLILNEKIVYDGSPKDAGFDECLHSVYGHHHWIKHD